MLPRFHWSDITTVGHYLGVLILLTGAAMCVPALVALAFAEFRQLGAFLVGIGACMLIGAALSFFKSHRMDRRRSMLLVGFGWIAIGLVASIPLLLSGTFESLFDALFDSVSALTTTGVTLASDVDAMSYSQVTWRVIMSFAGALTVVVIAMYSGFFGEGSKIFFMTERRDGERKRARVKETTLLVLRVYGACALVGFAAASVICLMLGISPVDAFFNGFWLSFTAIGTGGFVPHTSDLIYYHSLPLQLVLSILMIAGAISFGVYVNARRGRYQPIRSNAELRYYVLWIVALVVFVTVVMTGEKLFTAFGAFLQNGLMTIVSAVTTCGMQTVYPEQIGGTLSEGVVIMIIVAILFGACAYSSGGGIKFVRILQVLRWIKYSILVRLVPDNARVRIKYEHFGSRSLSSRDAQIAMTVFILYLGTAALGSMAFIAFGNDALDSVFEAISYVSNCGMTTTITQDGLQLPLKVVALLLMWAGRIEFVALIAAVVGILISLHPANLFSNGRSRDLRTRKNENAGGTAWRRRKGKMLLVAITLISVVALANPVLMPAGAEPNGAEVPVQDVQTLSNPSDYAQVDVKALLSAGERQDKRDVEIHAIATGSPIRADADHTWVNVKQDKSMIGVYMSNELADEITHYGSYSEEGDSLVIQGVYHLACTEHDGELDVHATSVQISALGAPRSHSSKPLLYMFGIGSVVIGGVLLLINLSVRGKIRWGRMFRHVTR